MKTKINLLFIMFALISLSNNLDAQTGPALFKDLSPGAAHSQPDQFMNVNGTMYFHTNGGSTGGYKHQLWKSDGTEANTVMIKDSIIFSAIGNVVFLRANVNGTLYFTVNKSGITAGDTTRLWKTDGTTPLLVATLPHPGYPGIGGGYPTGFTAVGNKLFFSMWKDNGRELWVSDGTEAGTMEVIDLNPGDNGAGYKYGGVSDKPMVAFNGKVYFQGSTTLGIFELFSSDGTDGGTTLVKAGVYNPQNFIVYRNELYFSAGNSNDELWKTDGTAPGTVKIATASFQSASIFNDQMFFTPSGHLWESDGTTEGTALVKDSAGQITGANNNYFFTGYLKFIAVSPYYVYEYWKSDGTTAGTVRVSDSLGASTSFAVINNKMYNSVATGGGSYTSSLWETDGTEAGTTKLITGYLGYPFIFNSAVFFSNFTSETGYELWYYKPGSTSVDEHYTNQLPLAYALDQNYPNPFNPSTTINFTISVSGFTTLNVYDIVGREVDVLLNGDINAGKHEVKFDASKLSSGMYFYQLRSGNFIETKKMLMVK